MSDERKISQLIKERELNIETDNHREAEHRLFQALGMAKQTRNLTLASKIINLLGKIGLFLIAAQSIECMHAAKAKVFNSEITLSFFCARSNRCRISEREVW